jgi:hypothetical protein
VQKINFFIIKLSLFVGPKLAVFILGSSMKRHIKCGTKYFHFYEYLLYCGHIASHIRTDVSYIKQARSAHVLGLTKQRMQTQCAFPGIPDAAQSEQPEFFFA